MSVAKAIPDEFEPALAKFASDGWRERKQAVQEVVALVHRPSMTDELIEQLIEHLIEEVIEPATISARAAAQEVLAQIGRPVVPHILSHVRQGSAAARLLIDLLVPLGRDEDVTELIEILSNHECDPNLRASIASVLGSIGSDEACEVLIKLLAEPSDHLKLFALDGLRAARKPVPVAVLSPLVENLLTRKAAVSVLAFAQEVQALEILLPRLHDTLRGARAAALVSAAHVLAWAQHKDDKTRDGAQALVAQLDVDGRGALVELAERGDREVACAALELAAVAGEVRVLGPALLRMDDGSIYERAVKLASVSGSATLEFFLDKIHRPEYASLREPMYRLAAVSGVESANDGWVEHLLQEVSLGDEEYAAAACDALGQIAGASALRKVFELCRQDGPIGEHAADAVANLMIRHSMSPLVTLRDMSPGKKVPMVGAIARNICRIIGRTGDASAVDILDEVLAGSDVEARVAAAVAIGRLPRTARSEEILCLALADEDPQARAAACRSLGQLGLRGAEDSLVAATGDPAAFVRAAAVQSLVLLGSPSCLGRLRDLIMDDESPSVVVHAIEGLGKLHEADDLMLLMNLCASKDVEVTKAAARALVGFHTHRATAALLGLLSHERWDVRWVAAEALTERADPTALESLRLAAQREEDPLVQETLTSAAERLAAQGGQHS